MDSPGRFFMEMLPAVAQVWLVAGLVVAGLLITGLIVLAIAIRTEDAPTKLGARAPGPLANRVRHMLRLHIYTRGDLRHGVPGRDRHEETTDPDASFDGRVSAAESLSADDPRRPMTMAAPGGGRSPQRAYAAAPEPRVPWPPRGYHGPA